MASKPVMVSFDENLLTRIDRDPEARERGRSAFIRSAVELYLAAKGRRETESQLARAYTDRADDLLEEIGEMLSHQSWPSA
jgi:metal-responsive CopG/Arc/MetJ family transcriptional regulator